MLITPRPSASALVRLIRSGSSALVIALLSSAPAVVSAQVAAAEYTEEAQALLANSAVASALQLAEDHDDWALERLIELTEIPAPPFMEALRGERFAELLIEAGADSVWTDA